MMGLLVQNTKILLASDTKYWHVSRKDSTEGFAKHNSDMCTMAFYKGYTGNGEVRRLSCYVPMIVVPLL